MPRLIDAYALDDKLAKQKHPLCVDDIRAMIADAPTVEIETVVHAHWKKEIWRARGGYKYQKCECGNDILVEKPRDAEIICCSACGKINDSSFEDYCPNCGAKMDEEA